MNIDKKQEKSGLYQALSAYCAGNDYPCHMPGHKRNSNSGEMADFYRIDITEIDGFDNLHHAQGLIKEAQERANRLYGAQETYYLVNGSTCGVLAAVMAVTQPGDEILIARNCHKAVYHATIMQGLVPRYYYPEILQEYGIYDGVNVEKIDALLEEYPSCKAVVITSPTYEGIISDIRAIANMVHERGRVLIVDEAHGAHLGLSDRVSESAVAAGADLVIHSLHKTLPAMTQTALLHVNGTLVDRNRLRKYLAMLQSSSPSYVLMASMDSCVRFLDEHREERFAFFQAQYESFCKKTAKCRYINIGKMTKVSENSYKLLDWDTGKILISVKDTFMSGPQLYDILREEYHLQMEMAADTFVLAMMTVMDTEEGWQRLADAICEIDGRIEKESLGKEQCEPGMNQDAGGKHSIPAHGEQAKAYTVNGSITAQEYPKSRMIPAQAFHSEQEEVSLQDAFGRVSGDFINLYPPGIPLIVPGEIMDEAVIRRIRISREAGLTVQGVSVSGRVRVVREQSERPIVGSG